MKAGEAKPLGFYLSGEYKQASSVLVLNLCLWMDVTGRKDEEKSDSSRCAEAK